MGRGAKMYNYYVILIVCEMSISQRQAVCEYKHFQLQCPIKLGK